MPRLWLTSLLIIVAALFAPLLFLPKEDEQYPEPETELSPAPVTVPEAESDGDYVFTVLGEDGVFETCMSDYLPGAVAAEMPALFDEAALKAQTVALRTYIMRMCLTGNPKHPQADVCVDPNCCTAWLDAEALQEKWGDDYEKNLSKITSAVRTTDGEYLTYEGEPIQAVFHASSDGHTENSSSLWSPVPYLVSVDSPETEETVQNFVTEAVFSPDELRSAVLKAFPSADLSADPGTWLGATELNETGRVANITLGGVSITGNDARSLFGLRSTDFDLVYGDGKFTFTVRGYGHGVGMSQQGANLLAEEGMDYIEILDHYYPGTTLIK
ncbi:MAG: stage II sporulation protein D [Oscillospiraceae bacterium]